MAYLVNRFDCRFVTEGGARVRYQAAVCGSCGCVELVRDNSNRNTLPPAVIAVELRTRGWHIAPRAKGDRCPKHFPHKAAPKPKPHPVTIIKDEAMAIAEPPRAATREDRRKINDALDVAYDVDRERYLGDGTDAKLAAQLGLPRAWVTEERERTFGPEANEADARKRALAGEAMTELIALTDQCMSLAQKCEDMQARVRKLIG